MDNPTVDPRATTDGEGGAPLRTLAWAIVIGLLLGTLSRYSSRLTPSLGWLGNVGAPWLLVSFFVGRSCRSVRIAVVCGAVTLAAAAVAHYVGYRLARFGVDSEFLRYPLSLWVVVGAVAGGLLGVLGFIVRHGSSVAGMWSTGALMACLAGEALLLFLVAPRHAYIVAGPVQLVAAGVLPFVVGTDRVKSYLVTAALMPFCAAGLWLMVVSIGRVYPGL